MNISSGLEIAGYPAIEIRELLRRHTSLQVKNAASYLYIGVRSAKQLLTELESEGYLEKEVIQRKTWWKVTPKGCGLIMASAAPPIKRSTADRLLKEVLQRVEDVNSSDEFLYRVTELIVFGSYLDESRSTLGDLDLAMGLERKEPDYDKYLKLLWAQVQKDGREYYTFFDQLFYPRYKVKKYLKNRSRGISLHDADDGILKTGIPVKTVYLFEGKIENPPV